MFLDRGALHRLTSCVASPLPCYRASEIMVDGAANQQVDEQRHAEDGDRDICGREVRSRYSCVEAPYGSNPEDHDCGLLPEDEPRNAEGKQWQAEEQQQVEDSPCCEVDGARH